MVRRRKAHVFGGKTGLQSTPKIKSRETVEGTMSVKQWRIELWPAHSFDSSRRNELRNRNQRWSSNEDLRNLAPFNVSLGDRKRKLRSCNDKYQRWKSSNIIYYTNSADFHRIHKLHFFNSKQFIELIKVISHE